LENTLTISQRASDDFVRSGSFNATRAERRFRRICAASECNPALLNVEDIEDLVQDVLLSMHAVRATDDPDRYFMP